MIDMNEVCKACGWEKIWLEASHYEALETCPIVANHLFIRDGWAYGYPEFIDILTKSARVIEEKQND